MATSTPNVGGAVEVPSPAASVTTVLAFTLDDMNLTYLGLLPPHLGGIAQHGANVAHGLEAAGNRVTKVSWRRPYPARLYPGDLVDPSSDPARGVRYTLDWRSPASWWRAGRGARTGDGLVLPWVTPFHGPATEIILRAARPTAAVAIVHNALPHERHVLDEPLARRALRGLSGAVVHAEDVARTVHRLAPHVPVEVVPHPPNLDLRRHPLPGCPPYRILVFGFVRAYKGVELALQALAVLRGRDVPIELTVAGRFWEPRERWEAAARDLGVGGAVRLIDRYIPDREVDELFATHHLVAAPYRSATQSGIVPLAFAAGRPVVATDVGGLGEVVRSGVNGQLTPIDAVALADGVAAVIDDLPALADGAAASATSWSELAGRLTEALGRA